MLYQLMSGNLTRYTEFRSGCDKFIAISNIFIEQGNRIVETCENVLKKTVMYWAVRDRLNSKFEEFGRSSIQITNFTEYIREELTNTSTDVEEIQKLIDNHIKFDKKCLEVFERALMAGVDMEEEQKNITRHEGAGNRSVPLGGQGGLGHNEKINKDFLPKDPFSLQMSSTEVRKW